MLKATGLVGFVTFIIYSACKGHWVVAVPWAVDAILLLLVYWLDRGQKKKMVASNVKPPSAFSESPAHSPCEVYEASCKGGEVIVVGHFLDDDD